MKQAPLIGMTSTRMLQEGSFLTGMPKTMLNSDYTDAVSRVGGIPLILPPVCTEAEIERFVSLCDGLVVTGGKDIAPMLYDEMTHPKCGAFDLDVDRSHLRLILGMLAANKPVLGICRGLQLINVALGGTLYQDLAAQAPDVGGHLFTFLRSDAVHRVSLTEDGALRKIFGKDTLEVNSIHHQAIHKLGRDVEVVATAPDGLVEAISVRGKQALGVQWHPEMLLQKNDETLCLFEHFAAQCI